MKAKDSGYVVRTARLKSVNPISYSHRLLSLGIHFSLETGEIFEIDSVSGITKRFMKDIMVGRSIYMDRDAIASELKKRYSGSSGLMLVIALKDAYNKVKAQHVSQ